LHKGRKEDMEDLLKEIRLNEAGLFPAIVRDEKGTVLMLAWMNREAFEKTISTGKAHFWSRSRKKLWLKGESSGHVQEVKEIRLDCDCFLPCISMWPHAIQDIIPVFTGI